MPNRTKILVVDDEAAVRLTLNRFLTASGFRVIECSDGAGVLAKVREERPAIVVLDVDMPVLDGWKTLADVRHSGSRVPVLMLTNVDNVPARVKGLESGADDYVGKPYDLIELLARVNALVRRSLMPSYVLPYLRFDSLVVDLERKTARRGEDPVNLTRTEFALLELFAQYRGRPVSRELMLKVVWGTNGLPNSHTLDTCLWRLRRKLGDTGKNPFWIRNLPGIGYVLECEFQLPETAGERLPEPK